MPHCRFLDCEVGSILFYWGNDQRFTRYDLDPIGFEFGYFLGIVREQTNRRKSQFLQNDRSRTKRTCIGAVAQGLVGFNGVHSIVL